MKAITKKVEKEQLRNQIANLDKSIAIEALPEHTRKILQMRQETLRAILNDEDWQIPLRHVMQFESKKPCETCTKSCQ